MVMIYMLSIYLWLWLMKICISDEVSGTSRDWASAVAGANYSYTVELRDTRHKGFLLPVTEILDQVDELWAGLKAMVMAIS